MLVQWLNVLSLTWALVVTHPDLPLHKLTVTDPTSLGVDDVKQYSGYLHASDNANLFYWFFESRNDPHKDPVVLWLNGGPGCSSLQAVLFENGPSTVDSNLKLTRNPYSWNNRANVIYLDQPVGVGFSDGNEVVSTTPQAADDVDAFLQLFFKQYPQFASSKFHIAGESYGGRYIPTFAEHLLKNGNSNVKLSSVLIGNGLVDPIAQYQAYEPMLCGQGGYQQKIPGYQCAMMRASIGACVNQLQACERGGQTSGSCTLAQNICAAQETPWQGLNPYDIRDATCAQANDGLCYPQMDWVSNYFNQAEVQRVLGADTTTYQTCNDRTNVRFNSVHDSFTQTQNNVTNLLNSNIPVLVYSGDKDIICNWLGGQQWTSQLTWDGQQQFQQAISSPQNWQVAGGPAGTVANYKHFTFLRVFDAGHMVPHDQPRNSYAMLQQWLDGDHGFQKKVKFETI